MEKPAAFAAFLSQRFLAGLPVDEAACDYAWDQCGVPDLASALGREDHPDHELLWDRAFYPDCELGKAAEPLIQALEGGEGAQKDIIAAMPNPKALLVFPGGQKVLLPIPVGALTRFVARLHVTKKFPPELLAVFRIRPEIEHALAARARSAKVCWNTQNIAFAARLLNTPEASGLESLFGDALEILPEVPEKIPPQDYLAERHALIRLLLARAEESGEELLSSPMETRFFLGGKKAYLDPFRLQRAYEKLDRLLLALNDLNRLAPELTFL